MTTDISLPIKNLPKKYSTLSNYGSHQDHETFAFQNENKT
jgi:hypothetical protein